MSAKIEVRIRNGKISIEVSGVEDASCADITRALEQSLGIVEDTQYKPNYYTELDEIKQEVYE